MFGWLTTLLWLEEMMGEEKEVEEMEEEEEKQDKKKEYYICKWKGKGLIGCNFKNFLGKYYD